LAVRPEAAAPSGDSLSQRTDACVAGCGCGGGSDYVFASLEDGETLISSDAGQTWKDLKQQVPSYVQKEPHHLRHIHTSHTDPRSVVLLTNTTTSWISRDAGNSWKPLKLATKTHGERRITAWRWHPTKKEWALAESKSEEPRGKAASKATKTKQSSALAFYTQDGGASFQLLAESVEQCHWAVRPRGDTRRVLFTRYTQQESPGMPLEIHAIEDFAYTKSTVLLGKDAPGNGPDTATSVFFHFNFIFALASARDLRLWFYSDASAGHRTFRAAKWPKGAKPQYPRQLSRMQVLYSAEDAAMIYVPVENPALSWGHVFSVNYQSDEISPVLTDVRRSGNLGDAEWQAVSGIDGAFIANRVVVERGSNLDKTERSFGAQEKDLDDDLANDRTAQESNLDGNDGEEATAQDQTTMKPHFFTRTYLSLDLGSIWQPLKAPEKGLSGETLPGCEAGPSSSSCLLHLARWESSFAAPGLILATGNTGVRLSDNLDHHSVFLSRDAGISWKQVLEGSHELVMLGHGDMFVAVPHKSPGTLLYSTDNGLQWTTVAIAAKDKGFEIEGIYTHPSHTDFRAFVALSSEARSGIVLASLDLRDALPQDCKLLNNPGAFDSDFEKWSPSDALEDAHASRRPVCILGARTSYIRRKPDHTCKTGSTKLAPLDLRKDIPCDCTAADWACDVGFHRTSYTADATCELLGGSPAPNVTKLCDATLAAEVLVTRGYTKVIGNRCTGGVNLSPRHEPCPGNTGLHGYLRGLLFSYRSPVYIAMGCMVVLSMLAIQRQRASKGPAGGIRGHLKKYDDSRIGHDLEDDPEREFLIDHTKI
jgi:hypothetical protein